MFSMDARLRVCKCERLDLLSCQLLAGVLIRFSIRQKHGEIEWFMHRDTWWISVDRCRTRRL